jgi:hypothetical protein
MNIAVVYLLGDGDQARVSDPRAIMARFALTQLVGANLLHHSGVGCSIVSEIRAEHDVKTDLTKVITSE